MVPNTPAFADKSEGEWGRLGRQGGSPGWVACLGWVARVGRPGWVARLGWVARVGRPGWVPKSNDLLNKFIDLCKNSV